MINSIESELRGRTAERQQGDKEIQAGEKEMDERGIGEREGIKSLS